MKINLCENEILPKVSQVCDTIIRTASAVMQGEEVDGTLNILFTDGAEIRRLNRAFRNMDSVTDVLSFPANELSGPISESNGAALLETDPETGEVVLGDIAVCLERAEEQAAEYGHSLLRELCFLVAHGTYHLMGYDHVLPGDEKKMIQKEEAILDQLGIRR